jgi:hypothetical protein
MTPRHAALIAPLLFALLTGCGQTPASAPALRAASTAQAASVAGAPGVTPEMAKALARLFDANNDGQISKNEGFVELVGPEKTNATLISNYYDEKYDSGDQVKPLPVKTFVDSLGKGFSLSVRAVKGDGRNANGLYDTIGMSAKEADRLADGLTEILKTSPLAKSGLVGGSLPVRRTVTPHYIFRKATDHVEQWSFSKVGSTIGKFLADKEKKVTIATRGQHAEGAFVLEIHEFPVM